MISLFLIIFVVAKKKKKKNRILFFTSIKIMLLDMCVPKFLCEKMDSIIINLTKF